MSDKSELHELIDTMSPVEAKAALQQVAALAQNYTGGNYVVAAWRSDIIWIIEETAVNFSGLVETFSKQGNELEK